jgi:hypothetical protein
MMLHFPSIPFIPRVNLPIQGFPIFFPIRARFSPIAVNDETQRVGDIAASESYISSKLELLFKMLNINKVLTYVHTNVVAVC